MALGRKISKEEIEDYCHTYFAQKSDPAFRLTLVVMQALNDMNTVVKFIKPKHSVDDPSGVIHEFTVQNSNIRNEELTAKMNESLAKIMEITV